MSSSSAAPSSRTRLPSTAGNTPLAALAGMLALATAFGLGLWRRRAA
jgi:LPXTG-motif cell wall-anchored protein